MFKDEYQSVCNAAKGKLGLLEKSPLGYFVSSIVAGMFIALGGFVTFTLGAHLTAAGCTIKIGRASCRERVCKQV